MASPHGLVTIHRRPSSAQSVLLHSLTGFLDAGSAGRLAVEHLMAELPNEKIAEIDIDSLYDYRARRPRMTFLTDHYGEIDIPELSVHELTDEAGTTFLVMHGPEPDFRWRAFADEAVWLALTLDTGLFLGVHAVPWPAPHTRPVNITAHSNDPALISDRQAFIGDLEVPGHVAGMLELRFDSEGIPAMGFAAHVPHYLSGAEYPRAAVALLEAVSAQTGLLLPLPGLRERAEESDADIAIQIAGEAENMQAVMMLEQQYDDFMASTGSTDIDAEEAELLDGEDIAAQVEEFLAGREHPEGPS